VHWPKSGRFDLSRAVEAAALGSQQLDEGVLWVGQATVAALCRVRARATDEGGNIV
jgi:hypothetical protein